MPGRRLFLGCQLTSQIVKSQKDPRIAHPRPSPFGVSGSLRERPPGVWEIRVALGRDPLTGNYRQVSRTVHGGKRKAQEETARIVVAAADGRHRGTKATVGFLLDRWLEHLERLGRSPKTLEGYRSLADSAIRPDLGKIELAKLTAADLDGFYARR
jgi:integrase